MGPVRTTGVQQANAIDLGIEQFVDVA